MSYNQYGGNPYRPLPGYGGYGNLPPGMGIPPPGLGPPPGISPGVPPHLSTQQSSRPGALPGNFQPPASMSNINFNAPVIRMGTATTGSGGRGDGTSASAGSRPGVGMERSSDQGRDRVREAVQSLVSPTIDEKLRTLVLYPLPEGLGGDHGIYKICNAVGRLQKWEPSTSLWSSHSPRLGFALFEDHDSVAIAIKLLREQTFEVPLHQQKPSTNHDQGETFDDIEKTRLKVSADETTTEYHASLQESGAEDADFLGKLETARAALKQVQRDLFFPPPGSQTSTNGAAVTSSNNESQGNVEVVNISIAQDDELADIPAEMREIVAQEIVAFRDRSNQRDMERQKREDEIGARFRLKNGVSTPSLGGANNIPLGPRATTSASAAPGPRGQDGHDRALSFANGGSGHADPELPDDSDASDASDAELARRKLEKEMREEDERFAELEHKWLNRERSRQSALDREQGRERQDAEQKKGRQEDQLNRELGWDDNVEEARKVHLYYRDHANWARVRASDRQEEDTRDDEDRREEEEEKRLEQAQLERARGQEDTFLDHQDQEPESHQAAAEPRRFKLSLGAAAQKAQASRAMPQRRTIAEVEGLLDDEDAEPSVRRQLVPIQMDAASGPGAMTEEEISQAVRALAQEIPSDKDGIWAWDVKWDYMDESIVRDRLRPFVEKKIVEYLGVQEEMLVAAVEEHLRKHGTAADLVVELAEALDDEAEELVKKFWRMVIFFTECEKRNLPT